MRPWTLHPNFSNRQTPLLSQLRTVTLDEVDTIFAATKPGASSDQEPRDTSSASAMGLAKQTSSVQHASTAQEPPLSKRRNIGRAVTTASNLDTVKGRHSYVAAWSYYIDGHVVSESNRRYLTNLLAATAARVVEDSDDSSTDSDELELESMPPHAGHMQLVEKTLRGIAARSSDDGVQVFGKHGSVIHLGRSLWQTLPLSAAEQVNVEERFFDDGTFPPCQEILQAAAEAVKNAEERPAPFGAGTPPSTTYVETNYGQLLSDWFAKILKEEESPNAEQLSVLITVRDRVLDEVELLKEGSSVRRLFPQLSRGIDREEPLRGLIHGLPGTGKSRVIKWICRMFTEALGWEHGVHFICVAFQNRVAYAMGGATLHAAGGISVGATSTVRKLDHTDVDILFTQNQHLRWVIIDEGFMIPDELLGHFAEKQTDAARDTRYKRRPNKTWRPMGGYNHLIFGDMLQIPPIPASAALFLPPTEKKTSIAKYALNWFWGDNEDSLNYFMELTIQCRIQDPWYSRFLDECRQGSLSDDMYNFIVGLPTAHPGSWIPTGVDTGYASCNNETCQHLSARWQEMALAGEPWSALHALECSVCKQERDRRNRLVQPEDPRLKMEPFLNAPYVHQNNEPKYHAMLLRSVEEAKRGEPKPRHILWVVAQDTPHNPKEIAGNLEKLKKKQERFLQFHDQRTAGIPGLCPMYVRLKGRVTEKIAKGRKLTILKHTPCTVVGWELHPADKMRSDAPERMLTYLPRCIYLHFADVTWRVHPDLDVGVFPLKAITRDWIVNASSGAKVSRRGFCFVPDFACTAFMVQGTTLPAEIAECGDLHSIPGITEMVTTYVILSRVGKAERLLLLRAFSPYLFKQGTPPGPQCLLKLLRARLGSSAVRNVTSTMSSPPQTRASTAQAPVATATKQPTASTAQCRTVVDEYSALLKQWEDQKRLRRIKGVEWPCFDCGQTYPAEGFGARPTVSKEVDALCVAPGHWRRCQTCQQAEHSGPREIQCEGSCGQLRAASFFPQRSSVCCACTARQSYDILVCGLCKSGKRGDQMLKSASHGGDYVCFQCAPELQMVECTVCSRARPLTEFKGKGKAWLQKCIRRCLDCRTCGKCKTSFDSATSFEVNSPLCRACYKQDRTQLCNACNKVLAVSCFNKDVLFHARVHQRLCVCLACHDIGYSPKDCKPYRCSTGHSCGHLKFDAQLLYNVRRENSSTLTCRQCLLDTVKCDACAEDKTAGDFDSKILENGRSLSRNVVCRSCQDRGYSPKDCSKYQCSKGHECGHLAFLATDLANSKRKQTAPICQNCKRRVQNLLTILKNKEAWRCTCKFKPTAGKKAYVALYDKRHEPRCQLTPTRAGEERWDGKNMMPPISKADLEFLAQGRNQQGKGSY